MKWEDLSPEQRRQAKEYYMIRLADKGRFIREIYGDSSEPERGPSYGELADADRLVSDKKMAEICAGTEFVPEDFSPGGSAKATVDTVCLALNKSIGLDYARPIAEEIAEEVDEDLDASADINWNSDDLAMAIGRVLCRKMGIQI